MRIKKTEKRASETEVMQNMNTVLCLPVQAVFENEEDGKKSIDDRDDAEYECSS